MRSHNKFSIKHFYASLTIAGSIALGLLTVGDSALAQSVSPQTTPTSISTTAQAKSKFDLPAMIEPGLTAISIIISTTGGIIVYWVNESKNRRQYIEGKIKDFETSVETVNVKKIMSAELQCIELFPFVEPAPHRYAIVEDCCWTEALLECKCNYTLREQYRQINRDEPLYQQQSAVKAGIRDSFNHFMYHLQHFEKMIQSRALDKHKLRSYLYPWFESLKEVNHSIHVECPLTKAKYTPQEAVLEYMGLLESIPEEKLSIVQKDVRALVTRYRCLSSFLGETSSQTQPNATTRPCPTPEVA